MLSYLLASGVSTGAIYALVAVGLVVVYRTTGHINFSHGELYMVGGFFAYTCYALLGWSYWVSVVAALAAAFVLGVLTDRLVYRPLVRSPGLSIVFATVGLSFLLKGIGRIFWGGQGDYVTFPPVLKSDPVSLGAIQVFPQQLMIVAVVIVVMVVVAAAFRLTTAGKAMQATAESQRAAYLVGIRVDRVYMYTWASSASFAALAGCLAAPLTLLSPDIGGPLLLKAFAATVLGGLGSMPGAFAGGLLIGIIESLAGGYIATGFQDVSAFVVIMAVLVVKPQGLFGTRAPRDA
jgi:branched-chain amino acid transport system permease protein